MDITLTSEIKALIRQHLAHGCSRSPESVLTKALHALHEVETMQARRRETPPPEQEGMTPSSEPAAQVSPLLQWLRDTAGPPVELEALHRRLATIPGSMADAIREERDDRI